MSVGSHLAIESVWHSGRSAGRCAASVYDNTGHDSMSRRPDRSPSWMTGWWN